MYGNWNGCGCRSFRDTKNKVSPLTKVQKLSDYVFCDHQTTSTINIIMSLKVPDHFKVIHKDNNEQIHALFYLLELKVKINSKSMFFNFCM